MNITHKVNQYGELLLSAEHNGRIVTRKYMYYSVHEAMIRFRQFLKHCN